jgi:micrococcal nuclease
MVLLINIIIMERVEMKRILNLFIFINRQTFVSFRKKTAALMGSMLLFTAIATGCLDENQPVPKETGNQQQEVSSPTITDHEQNGQQKEEAEQIQVKGKPAKVVETIDGDTIKVRLENGTIEKVRMILIDTPETKHPRLGVQPFGIEASQFTERELTGKDVTLELDVQERDRYGRLLAYILVGDVLFNEKLLEKGLARVAVFPPNTKYVDRFREVQEKAQAEKIGIWSIEDYVTDKGYNAP